MENVEQTQVRIKCDQTGEIYESLRSAAKKNNLRASRLREHLKNREWIPEINGLTFRKIE